jgi:phosphoribosylamine---glycine ligase
MARILCLDTATNGLDFLMRCQAAGHSVLWYDKTKKNRERPTAGKNIVPKIEDFDELRRKWIDWADIIWLTDNTTYVEMLEPLRLSGYPIFGAGTTAAQLELDRDKGQSAMKKCGLNVIDGRGFHDYDSAIAYVAKEGKAFVSKPSGDADKALSYVAKSPSDLIYMLERWKKNPDYVAKARSDGFILQEKVNGTEMAVGGWFGPNGFCDVFLENFEHKKLHDGDIGPNTGEMGTLARYVRKSKLADQILLPLTKMLHSLDYVGYVDNNAIIEDDGTPRPLELTMRDGWPLWYNVTALHRHMDDPLQWMLDLLKGKDTIDVHEGEVSVSVLVALPPFPYQHVVGKDLDGIPLYNATDTDHVHLCEVRLADDVPCMAGDQYVRMPCYVCTGEYPIVVTGCGDTITGARRSAYAALKKIEIPNDPFYRLDIGAPKRLREGIPKIQAMGYAKGLET